MTDNPTPEWWRKTKPSTAHSLPKRPFFFRQRITSPPCYTLLLGNPGVGKSTLLNGLVGKPIFEAGISFGRGLTQSTQIHKSESGRLLVDTPGLSDVRLRELAAKEISEALRQDGWYQLVFVVTEEEGRVRPADVTMMKLVLGALPKDKDIPYGIVVNKMTKGLVDRLEQNTKEKELFVACLNEGRDHPTPFIHFYLRNKDLVNKDNAVHEITPEFECFLELLPHVHISKEEVADVRTDDFDSLLEEHERELMLLRSENEALKRKLAKDRDELLHHLQNVEDMLKKQSSRSPMRKLASVGAAIVTFLLPFLA